MTTYACAVCWDDNEGTPAVQFKDYSLCTDCAALTTERFGDAFRDEAYYPPRFGHDKLLPADFAHLLSPGFAAAYALKEREYAIPPQDRLYCPHYIGVRNYDGIMRDQACSAFLGVRSKWTGERVECKECHGTVCTYCRTDNTLSGKQDLHVCRKSQTADDFKGQSHGKHHRATPAKKPKVQYQSLWTDEVPLRDRKQRKEHAVPEVQSGGDDCQPNTRSLVWRTKEWNQNIGGPGAVFVPEDLEWARDCAKLLHEAKDEIVADIMQLSQNDELVPDSLTRTHNIVRNVHAIAFSMSHMDRPGSLAGWYGVEAECRRYVDEIQGDLDVLNDVMAGEWSLVLDSAIEVVMGRFKETANVLQSQIGQYPTSWHLEVPPSGPLVGLERPFECMKES